MKDKNKKGFTIVELIVVVSVIAIISLITGVSYTSIQRDARDTTRKANAIIVSEALEKYYDGNGEYPSVPSLINTDPLNTAAAVAQKLGIRPDDLKMPKMPPSPDNGITTGALPNNDYMSYTGPAAHACLTDPAVSCPAFTLEYVEEGSGSIKTFTSRRR